MKKRLLTLSFVLAAITASAQQTAPVQKPEYQLPDGLLAVELQFNPFSNDFNTFKMAELKGRLFLNDRHVIRLGIGIGYDTNKDETNYNQDTRPEGGSSYTVMLGNTTTESKQTAFKVALGYENHFAHYGRLDFYGGAEVGYEGKFYSGSKNTTRSTITAYGTPSVTNNNFDNYDYNKMLPDGSKFNEHSFFANVFTGVDFYVYKNLYIGTELGISFKTGKQNNGYFTQTEGVNEYTGSQLTTSWDRTYSSETGISILNDHISGTTSTTANPVTDHSSKSTSLKVYVEPAIRLGWIF